MRRIGSYTERAACTVTCKIWSPLSGPVAGLPGSSLLHFAGQNGQWSKLDWARRAKRNGKQRWKKTEKKDKGNKTRNKALDRGDIISAFFSGEMNVFVASDVAGTESSVV